jgi:TolA-binding protein
MLSFRISINSYSMGFFDIRLGAFERLSIYRLFTIPFRMNETYLKQLNAKIKEMDEEIVKLQKQAKEKSSQAQEEFNRRMEQIKEQRKDLQQKVDNLTKTGKEAAKDVTAGIDRAVEEMKNALKQARSRFQ